MRQDIGLGCVLTGESSTISCGDDTDLDGGTETGVDTESDLDSSQTLQGRHGGLPLQTNPKSAVGAGFSRP